MSQYIDKKFSFSPEQIAALHRTLGEVKARDPHSRENLSSLMRRIFDAGLDDVRKGFGLAADEGGQAE